MNKLNPLSSLSLKRLLPSCLASLAAWVLLAPAAQATPYIVKLTQQGSNVVARGSGSIDLHGLTSYTFPYNGGGYIAPNAAYIGTGPTLPDSLADYGGFTGPSSFGNGIGANATTVSGDAVQIYGGPFPYGAPSLWVSPGYVSGTLTSSATWDNKTLTSLGVTPGTYTWTWGSGTGDQSFTLLIGNVASVPEPAVLGMFGCGLLLVGVFARRRRRVA